MSVDSEVTIEINAVYIFNQHYFVMYYDLYLRNYHYHILKLMTNFIRVQS